VSVSVSYREFCVFVNAKEQGSRRGLFVCRNPPFVAWLPRVNFWPGCWRVGVPLWAPFLMVAIPAHFLIVATKKRLPGECRRCGRDLSRSDAAVCPGCGATG
jgi:hypothetical protein